MNMQNETNTKAEIIALLEGRTQASLENVRQFILDLDEGITWSSSILATPISP
jgi:hypothetical protein